MKNDVKKGIFNFLINFSENKNLDLFDQKLKKKVKDK